MQKWFVNTEISDTIKLNDIVFLQASHVLVSYGLSDELRFGIDEVFIVVVLLKFVLCNEEI